MIGRPRNLRDLLLIALIAVVATLSGARPAVAGSTDLLIAWSANTEPDIAGYRLSYGTVTLTALSNEPGRLFVST